jgi:hypothetical protein
MKENYILFYNTSLQGYTALIHLLSKAESFCVEKGVSEEEMLDSKLAPDMFNFKKQIQVFTDGTVGGVYRLAGLEKPAMPDAEITISDLKTRVENARMLLEKVDPSKVEGLETRIIKLPWMPAGGYFESKYFLEEFLFRNNLFHLTTAYNILRMKGVQIGKADFLNGYGLKMEQ